MSNRIAEKSFFIFLLIAVLVLAAIIFFPFLTVLVLGASFAVVLNPVYEWLKKHLFNSSLLSAILTVLLFIVLVVGPLFLAVSLVFQETQGVLTANTTSGPFIQAIERSVNSVIPEAFHVNGQELLAQATSYISSNVGNVFSATLTTIFSFFLMILAIFYFLKDGGHWRRSLIEFSPLEDKNDSLILDHLKEAINGVVKGYLFIGLLQGILMGIGLAIFGVPNAALWGMIAGIASLIPTIGTALVSIPIIVFLLSTGQAPQALGVGIWAGILVGGVDNLLNPIIVGKKVRVSPLFILFSVLGGIALMGPVGILVGPLVMSLLYSLLVVYRKIFQPAV